MRIKALVWIPCIFFAILAFFSIAFFSRKPVLLVTDKPFELLYGENRSRQRQYMLSLQLFRRIKTIRIAEDAGPDLVAQAAASLSRRPFAAIFPYRYWEGAQRYLSDRPHHTVIILGGRNNGESQVYDTNGSPAPLWLFTDTETDLFRAGAISGLYALGGGVGTDLNIALYMEGLSETDKTAFSRGVAEYWPVGPLFSPELEENHLVCAVLMNNFQFSIENNPRSLILFSWMNPLFAVKNTLAIFDDSPWAQIRAAVAFLQGRNSHSDAIYIVPSEIILIGRDMMPKNHQIEVNKVKNLRYWPENADN